MIIAQNYADLLEVADQSVPAASRIRLYAHTDSILKMILPSGEIRVFTAVNTYKGVAVGAHTFGAGDFTDLPATLENVPIVVPQVVGDGAAGISGLSTGGFTLFDRGIGTITSIDILVYLR